MTDAGFSATAAPTSAPPLHTLHVFSKHAHQAEIRERHITTIPAIRWMLFVDDALIESRQYQGARLQDYPGELEECCASLRRTGWRKGGSGKSRRRGSYTGPYPNPMAGLKFIVAPHIVQDLGLNLYTDLPRVLVEFVANAYDADSPNVRLTYDKDKIDEARKEIREKHPKKGAKIPLEETVLPDDLKIVIEDSGHGMSRDDLQDRFLVAGRRRREADAPAAGEQKMTSDGGRVLMGRKGLGKLAGFGVAQKLEIISKKNGENHCTKITLDYADLVKKRTTNEIDIPDEKLSADSIPGPKGTRIILSRLLYGPTQSRAGTVSDALAEHFMFVDPAEFKIVMNGDEVKPFKRDLAYAWPEPDKPVDEFVGGSYEVEEGRAVAFQYRIRFTGRKQALPAKERGVRVYAHKRLAAAPSLLKADTNMHGFRMTDYMDGVVKADFLDDQPSDYTATDRQTLRWDTPLLEPLYLFLSNAIKEACKAYQAFRDEEAKKEVEVDQFTKNLIDAAGLPKKHTSVAYKIAAILETSFKQGTEDPEYRRHLPIVVKGLGHGQIMGAIAELAKQQATPNIERVVAEITALAKDEIEQHLSYIRGRLDGITALRRIVKDRDFTKGRNEKKLQHLFENAPWLIDPTFFTFLAADTQERTMYGELEKALGIHNHVPKGYNPNDETETKPGGTNKRPDLVFVLGNAGLQRIVIVELKAPNTPLYGEHLRQLQGYMRRARQWCNEHGKKGTRIEGILLGTFAKLDARADDVEWLREQIEQAGTKEFWQVFDLLEVLEKTEAAHRELLDMQKEDD